MSATYVNLLQWLVILAFFLLVVGAMFAEAFWLSRKGWASFGRAFAFSALSNFIGFGIGLFTFFIVFGLFLMFSLDGSLDRAIKSSPIGNPLAVAILIFAVLLTPILLIICKRIFLSVLKIQTGKTAWLFALVSSFLIFVIALGVPVLFGYFIFR